MLPIPTYLIETVRMMPDNTLEILGRVDSQIKLRGVRIESEGISTVLAQIAESLLNDYVDAYTILARHPDLSADQLVTFFSPRSSSSSIPLHTRKSNKVPVILRLPDLVQKIRPAAQKHLAAYMMPSHIIPIEWLPLSANGKTDEKFMKSIFETTSLENLGKLSRKSQQPSRSHIPDELMRHILSLVARHVTLEGREFDADTNLFAYGLDSMKFVQLSVDVRRELGVSVDVAKIMDNPTVKGIADFVQADRSKDDGETSYQHKHVEVFAEKV